MITLKINQQPVSSEPGVSILKAALSTGIYIPHLCSHPDLLPIADCGLRIADWIYQGTTQIKNHPQEMELGCKLCLVEVSGKPELLKACELTVSEGIEVLTETERIKQARQQNLSKILAEHPHSCLTCAQSQGCSLTQCSSNVPVNERCCKKFGKCEIQKVSQYIGISPSTPRYVPKNIAIIENDPLIRRDYNLCISCLRCVRACADLRGAHSLGYVFDSAAVEAGRLQPTIPGCNSLPLKQPEYNKTIVGSKAQTLKDSNCHFCGLCVAVCPTGALLNKDEDKDPVPCRATCPINMDVPAYISAIRNNDYPKAAEIIYANTVFGSVLGRVCFHPCESNCQRKDVNEAISICGLKRYATEQAEIAALTPPGGFARNDSKVAIIGAGPAGLSAAHYLNQYGYAVTVFESEPEPGGMMRYAIPEYRLPTAVLQKDIKRLLEAGVTIKTSQRFGRDFSIDSLRRDGFKAILVAIGAQLPKILKLANAYTPPAPSQEGNQFTKSPLSRGDSGVCRAEDSRIIGGIDFLKSIRHNSPKPKTQVSGKRVLVIGGGNVAIDVAISAKRLGAKEVQLACLESPTEMPAHSWEIEQAKREGININCSWGPTGVSDKGVEFTQCTCVFDEHKCFNPKFNQSITKTIPADVVILAIGQVTDKSLLPPTDSKNIFFAGEVVHNPSSVVEAIADGIKAAESIDAYLSGTAITTKTQRTQSGKISFNYTHRPNAKITAFANLVRVSEMEKCYTKQQGLDESARCLQCDVRLLVSPVILPPGKQALEFTAVNLYSIPAASGVYQLLDHDKKVIVIKGVLDLKQGLTEALTTNKTAKFFEYEEEQMYTKRESELIQQFLQKEGKLPGGGDELDELY